MAENEQLIAQNGSIKETIYMIFDSVLPAETGHKLIGINEYQELAETFRKFVDMAVDEHEDTVITYTNACIEAVNATNSELNAKIIEKDAQLQEALRKAKYAEEISKQSDSECERYAQKIEQLQGENESLSEKVEDLTNNLNDMINRAAELNDELTAKDGQIAKLTEEINKPKAAIVIPSQSKPSVTLQQLMEEAKSKSVKSQLDLALSGQNFRGKVELAIPPSYKGGDEETESTFQADTKVNAEIGRLHIPEVSVTEQTPSQEEEPAVGLDQHVALSESYEPTIGERIEALEARILRIEQQTGLV